MNVRMDTDDSPPNSYNNLYHISKHGNGYSIYISDYIDKPSLYYPLYEVLRGCQPHEEVHLYLNTGGGRIDTTFQLMSCMSECQGTIAGHLDHQVASAGTYLALCCHTWVLTPFTTFMIHSDTSGMFGKRNEIVADYEFTRPWLDNIMREVYSGFLTKKEIEEVLKGEDKYFNADQLSERLEKYTNNRERLYKKYTKEIQN